MNREEETLEAKLRNQLTPIYGLSNIVLAMINNPGIGLEKIVLESIDQINTNKPIIDDILKQLENR